MPSHSDLRMKWFGTDDQAEIEKMVIDPTHAQEDFRRQIKMQWPYYAPTECLPAPLPTIEDIEKVAGTEDDLTRDRGGVMERWRESGFKYRVNGFFLVKIIGSVAAADVAQEAENLLFLHENSSVRVPKLYAAFDHKGGDPYGLLRGTPGVPRRRGDGRPAPPESRDHLPSYHYLIMGYPEAGSLQDKWHSLDHAARVDIGLKIGEQFRLLRSIPSPGYYGRVHEQPLRTVFEGMNRLPNPLGPYKTYSDFTNTLADIYEIRVALVPPVVFEYAKTFRGESEWFLYLSLLDNFRSEALACQASEPTFSHPSLCFANVYLEPNVAASQDGKEVFEVVLADWKSGGWLPGWVNAAALTRFHRDAETPDELLSEEYHKSFDEIKEYATQALTPFPHKEVKWWNVNRGITAFDATHVRYY